MCCMEVNDEVGDERAIYNLPRNLAYLCGCTTTLATLIKILSKYSYV